MDNNAAHVLEAGLAEAADPVAEPAQDAAPVPPILIQIDPAVSGGFIYGRFDVQIRGRVASPAAVEEIELESGGVVLARAMFGEPHRAPPVRTPDGTTGRQRAFQLCLPQPQDGAAEPCHCVLRARTAEGHSHTEALDIAIDPTAPEPVMVRSGPVAGGVAHTGGRPQIVLYVERAVLDNDGNLAVRGWAVAMTPIVTVQVFVGGHERLPAAQLGGQRDDVANFYPAYPNGRTSGFTCNGHVDQPVASLTSVRVQAITMHGFAMETVVPLERIESRPAARPAAPAPPPPDEPRSFAPLRQDPAYKLTADFRISADPYPLPSVPPPLPPRNGHQLDR